MSDDKTASSIKTRHMRGMGSAIGDGAILAGVRGQGGIGKTALALRLAEILACATPPRRSTWTCAARAANPSPPPRPWRMWSFNNPIEERA